jgi:hypothetical protein
VNPSSLTPCAYARAIAGSPPSSICGNTTPMRVWRSTTPHRTCFPCDEIHKVHGVLLFGVGTPLKPRFDQGACRPGDQAETPLWMPRLISFCRPGLPAGVVSRQLQLRVLNGFGWAPVEFVSALAGAAIPTKAPTAIAVPTSILVITWQ